MKAMVTRAGGRGVGCGVAVTTTGAGDAVGVASEIAMPSGVAGVASPVQATTRRVRATSGIRGRSRVTSGGVIAVACLKVARILGCCSLSMAIED